MNFLLPSSGVCERASEVRDIAAGGLLSLQGRRGMVIRCERGVAWVTQTGDERDIVLAAGEAFTCARTGKVVVTALRDARVCVEG